MITSFRHDEQKRKKRRKILLTLLFISLLLLLMRGPVANLLGGALSYIGRPFWTLRDGTMNRFSSVITLISSKSALENENKKLRETLDQVALEAYGTEQLRTENEKLKEMLGRSEERLYIVSRILSAPPTSPYDTVLVDAGTNQGVTLGTTAFAQGDFKVGEVTRVWKESALISLFSSPNNELSVNVGKSGIPATAFGVGGGNLRIILPKGTLVERGDLVEIPSISPEYAGIVDAVDQPEGSSLEAVYLRLPFNMFSQKWLYLSVNKNNDS